MMLKLPDKIYISSANVDMRKSIDGLVSIVEVGTKPFGDVHFSVSFYRLGTHPKALRDFRNGYM